MWGMLRPGFGLLMVLVVGCSDGEAPPLLGADFSAAVMDMVGNPTVDLLDVDNAGADLFRISCATVCDCPAGNNCESGSCVPGTVTLFCCGAAGCTGTNACQQPNGGVSQCSN